MSLSSFSLAPQRLPLFTESNHVTDHASAGATTVTMSLEAVYNLSISDLLHVLNEKLGLESSKLQGISLPLTHLASSLESEVSVPWWINLDSELTSKFDRSTAWKPERGIF